MLLLLPGTPPACDRLLDGPAALLYLMWRIWWAWPFALLASLPGLRQLLTPLYGWVARNRYALSHACNRDGCSIDGRR